MNINIMEVIGLALLCVVFSASLVVATFTVVEIIQEWYAKWRAPDEPKTTYVEPRINLRICSTHRGIAARQQRKGGGKVYYWMNYCSRGAEVACRMKTIRITRIEFDALFGEYTEVPL
jgi:hypothetical protein